MNIKNCLNKVFYSFDSLNKELFPEFCLVDTFSNCFSFLLVNLKDLNVINAYWNRLDNVFENSLINQNIILITLNTSVKNNIATSISHIYREQEIITKSVHHAMNVTSTEAKLLTIRCSINCTIHLQNIECIIVITDTIPVTKWIFNTSVHLYQLYSITISKNLKEFFK